MLSVAYSNRMLAPQLVKLCMSHFVDVKLCFMNPLYSVLTIIHPVKASANPTIPQNHDWKYDPENVN